MCGHLRCSSNGYLFIINMSINGQRVTLFCPAAVAEFFPSSFLTDFISFRWTSKWDPIRPDPGLFLWEIQSDRPEDIVRWSRRREWGEVEGGQNAAASIHRYYTHNMFCRLTVQSEYNKRQTYRAPSVVFNEPWQAEKSTAHVLCMCVCGQSLLIPNKTNGCRNSRQIKTNKINGGCWSDSFFFVSSRLTIYNAQRGRPLLYTSKHQISIGIGTRSSYFFLFFSPLDFL